MKQSCILGEKCSNAMGREFKYGGTIGGNDTLVGETLETG